jgi:hypothetical protein
MKRLRTFFHKPNEQGQLMVGALGVLFFFMIISLAVAEFGSQHYLSTRRSLVNVNALAVAEAGGDNFMYNINSNSAYAGSSGAVTLYSNTVQGKGTYQTTVTNGSITNEKIVTSVGKIYLPATASAPLVTRTVKLTIEGTSSTPYAVQTGPGGLILTNSASVGNGDVYVNGYIQMSNSARIGSTSSPSNVYVANANCPANGGATYPTVCSSGQPISISNQAHIYGTVNATGQTNGSGMSNPGLVSGGTAPVVSLPSDDRTSQVNAVATTETGSTASCSNNQTRTLTANTHITGNFSASNNCVVTVKGDIWIDGNFTLSNSTVFKVDPSIATPIRVMVDGEDGISLSNSSAVAANSSGIGFKFVAYASAASCSPSCSNVTGTDLYNSRNMTTINLNNTALAAGSSFYARWTKVSVSNGGSVGSVMGQTVQLNNSGTLTFGGVSGGGSATSWDVRYYQQTFK